MAIHCLLLFLILIAGALQNQKEPKQLKHDKPVSAVSFSSDGRILAACSGDEVVIWDVAKVTELKRLVRFHEQAKPVVAKRIFFEGAPKYPPDVTISSDGRTVEATWDFDPGWRATHRWDIATASELSVTTKESKGAGWFPAISTPDGKTRATADKDRSKGFIAGKPPTPGTDVLIVDAASGRELRVLRGHQEKITALAFAPKGDMLASGAEDKMVRLWILATGKEARKLDGPNGPIRALAFSTNGKSLAVGSEDGIVRIWDIADVDRVK